MPPEIAGITLDQFTDLYIRTFQPFEPKPINAEEEITMNKEIKTIRDARGKHYEIFKGPDNAKRGEKEGILKYIDTLGAETHTDVSEWELDKFMHRGQLITDKRKINELFFKAKAAIGKIKPKAKKVYHSADKLKALAIRLAVNMDGRIEKIRADNRYRIEQEAELKREILKYERARIEAEEEIRKIEEKPKDFANLVPEIRAILKEGNYSLHPDQKEYKDTIRFVTRPIIKSFFSKEQATNLRVPLGQFTVDISVLGNGEFGHAVQPYKDNIKAGAYWHPHLQNGTQLCFGDVRRRYLGAARERDLKGVLDAIWDVLQNFEDRGNDGYVPLFRYEEEYKKKLKLKGAQDGKKKQTQEVPF